MSKLSQLVHKYERYILLSIILSSSVYFLLNINHFVPMDDFFNYVYEGKSLWKNPFYWTVHPPLYSFFIYLLEIIPVNQSAIIAGRLFNIFFFALLEYFLWKLSRKWLGLYSLFAVILLTINPQSFYSVLQPTSFVLSALLVIISVYYSETKPKLSLLFAVMAFFVRNENIILFPILFMWNRLISKRKLKSVWYLIAAIPILIWLVRFFYSDTHYGPEYTAFSSEVPNFTFISDALYSGLYSGTYNSPLGGFVTLFWISLGIYQNLRKKIFLSLSIWILTVFYSLTYTFYHTYDIKYGFVVMPFAILLLLWPCVNYGKYSIKKTAFVIVFLTILNSISIMNAINISKERSVYLQGCENNKANVLEAEWINNNIHNKSLIYGHKILVTDYYVNNPWVKIAYFELYNNEAVKKYLEDSKVDVYVLIHQSDVSLSNTNEEYWNKQTKLDYINNLPYGELKEDFKQIDLIKCGGDKIYIYKSIQ